MPAEKDRVVLVHGLWMNRFAMLPLAMRIEHCGFDVIRYGYRSVGRGLHENARQLAALCERTPQPVHLFGHSLGGLVILSMMQAHPEIRVHRVVLAGSPYGDIASAHGLERFAWGHGALGKTIDDWLREPRPPLRDGVEVGIIAGSISMGLGKLFVTLPMPNDGVVRLEETRVPGAADSIVVHASHSGMLVSSAVARAACDFLRSGKFQH
jgi:pimeloyl-ACP methyl ester carboxylesterase